MDQNDLLSSAINKTGTSTPQNPTIDVKEMAKSPYGNLEISKHLYESGLQNIFNDYETNISSLDQSKQKSLADQYYIREMSKKYLGEYASNTGAGDVSGNLLDIYGSYQKNKEEITQNYDALKLNLTQEYRNKKAELFNQKLINEYGIALADFEEAEQEIIFNASTGEFDSQFGNGFEYLKSKMDSGELSKASYRNAYGALYSTMIDRIGMNLENQNFEGKANATEYLESFSNLTPEDRSMLQGIVKEVDKRENRTNVINKLNTQDYGDLEAFEFLEQNRKLIGEEAYESYFNAIYANEAERAFSGEGFDPETMSVDEYVKQFEGKLSSTDIKVLRSETQKYVDSYNQAKISRGLTDPNSSDYLGDDYNFQALTGEKDVDRSSYAYKDSNGNIMFSITKSSEQEGEDGWFANHEDLNKKHGGDPREGEEIRFTATHEKDGSRKDFDYVYLNGNWHRMVQERKILDTEMALWQGEQKSGSDWSIQRTTPKMRGSGETSKMIFNYKGISYHQEKEIKDPKVSHQFAKIHGNVNDTVIFHENKFYIKSNGKIFEMKKK